MRTTVDSIPDLALRLREERNRQGLSRDQAAAVCNVSTSFIRAAESDPGNCTLVKLLKLAGGLGLAVDITGWQIEEPESPTPRKTAS